MASTKKNPIRSSALYLTLFWIGFAVVIMVISQVENLSLLKVATDPRTLMVFVPCSVIAAVEGFRFALDAEDLGPSGQA